MKKLLSICLIASGSILTATAQQSLPGASAEGQKMYKALVAKDEALVQKIQALNKSLELHKKQKNKALIIQTEEKIKQAGNRKERQAV